MDTSEKARESRLRRLVRRQGLLLQKSRCRTPDDLRFGRFTDDYGCYKCAVCHPPPESQW